VVFAEDLHDGRASVHEREQLDGPGVDAAQDLELILNTLCPIVFREGVSEKAFQTFLLRLFGLRWAHAGSSANPKAHRADAPGSIGVARATMGGMGPSEGNPKSIAFYRDAICALLRALKQGSEGPMVRFERRQFLKFAGAAVAAPALSLVARAQTYPAKPVRFIHGYVAGGSAEITARLIGQWLSERLGQQFVIESRPGAGSNIGTDAVVRAPPDGYTILLVAPANAINATLYEKLPYNFIRDIAPVAGLIRFPNVMEVNPSLPVKTVPEFIAYAKANPGRINMASSGNGSTIHMSGELFKMMTGITMVHVPYRGAAPALTDMIGGQVEVMFDNLPSSIEYVRTGRLRALAVTTARRSEVLPDIPTVGDFVPGYESSAWYGVGVPRNTAPAIIELLNREINAGLADPKLKARFADLSAAVMPGSPEDFGRLIAEETEKWGKVVKFAGVKAE
jgi:tripartite-type tricarboxylate transporter receptor subunit TctC